MEEDVDITKLDAVMIWISQSNASFSYAAIVRHLLINLERKWEQFGAYFFQIKSKIASLLLLILNSLIKVAVYTLVSRIELPLVSQQKKTNFWEY